MKFSVVAVAASLFLFGNIVANAQTTYPCPAAGSSSPLPLTSTNGPTTIRLPIISAPDGLCILTRRSISTKKQRAPVVRSYGRSGGVNVWERSAGIYARTGSGVSVDCSGGSGTTCDVSVPALDEGMEYVLESYEYGNSVEAEAARFLEQATFGPTRESIDALTSSTNDFPSWVATQMSLPISSHREFFRKRLNPKYEMPYNIGAIGPRPCELHSRWRRYALTSRDQLRDRKVSWWKHLTVEDIGGGKFVWKVDGNFRTVTTSPPVGIDGTALTLGARHKIIHEQGSSWQVDCVGCEVVLEYSGDEYIIANPEVSLEGIEGDTSILPYNVVSLPDYKSSDLPTIESPDEYPLFAQYIHANENAILNTTTLEGSTECDGFPTFRQPFPLNEADAPPHTFPAVFGKSLDVNTGEEVVFAYDPHLALYENSVENPLEDGGGQLAIDTHGARAGTGDFGRITQVMCQNVQRSFLNKDHCKLSYHPNVCAPGQDPNEVITVDESTIEGINTLMGTKLYVLTGLPITADHVDTDGDPYLTSPCASSESRWVRDPSDTVCANTAGLGPETIKTFSNLITGKGMTYNDFNPNVVDVHRAIRSCDAGDTTKLELGNVQVGGNCWKHVHPAELSVVDLTTADVTKYTVTSSPRVTISDMDWFYTQSITVIGALDDHIELDGSEPSPLDDASVQDAYKALEYNPSEAGVLVCGSPNEVASDPWYGDHGFDATHPEGTGYRTMSIWGLAAQRHTTWTHMALKAPDQLRQKMAWSLSQIVSVGLPGSGMVFNEETEHYIAFYDLFVNHAFGNYRDLMKEFSFNVIMGEWLSFKGNKSLQYNKDVEGKENYPDENFAREIMQLFSVGLNSVNMDGSNIVNEEGITQETYTQDDIMSYARAWTGLTALPTRGGVSTGERQWNDKIIDPMKIEAGYRDVFPKNDLNGGYLGDKVALCEDLPSKHFLKKGATYLALGSTPIPEMHNDRDEWTSDPDFLRLEVLPASPLYVKLCGADANGDCTWSTKVVLTENLVYDAAAQSGAEYAVDTIRTVALYVGLDHPIYYEYIRQPCVESAFYNNGKKLTKDQIWSSDGPDQYVIKPGLCGNPKLEVASPMCLGGGWETEVGSSGKIFCRYQGERMTYASAEAICAENDLEQGHPWWFKTPLKRGGPCANGADKESFRSWANAACAARVKVSFEDGQVAIVHSPDPDHAGQAQVEDLISPDTMNFFKAFWDNGSYPSMNDCLAIPTCQEHGTNYCICDTVTSENAVFASTNEVSSIDDLMSLKTGAVDPALFEAGTYTSLGDCAISGVTVYSTQGDCSTLRYDTIFAFVYKSKQYYLKNSKSKVSIPGSDFALRNPVHFNSLADPEARDMYHETDSVLDSLFYHPSHPPFMAQRVIQRFGVSNASPSFIERVSTAYSTGSYGQFGTGKYGDLGAMVAAILLDDETREVVLDVDPAHGHIREPLVKVLSFFRSMDISFRSPLHIPTLLDLEDRIGQGSYESPSVFSFFLPEFIPSISSAQSAGLVSPESMVLSGDNTLTLLDSIFSVVKFGVSDCYSPSLEGWRVSMKNVFSCAASEGDTSLSPAKADYWPSSTASVDDILDDLSVLLTAGRLGDINRATIKPFVEQVYNTGDVSKAVRVAQQLIFSSPEFHSTAVARNLNDKREITGYTEPPTSSYRAVVVFMMLGGADSFNLLVPVSDCETSDQYQEYVAARGQLHALPIANLTTISAATSGQDCATFGVNKAFDVLGQLYNNNEALFLANTGTLAKHMTKHDDWNGETPIQLFAHNTMTHELYRGDPYNLNANTGVFGRILDKLKLQGYQTSANSVGAGSTMLTGDQQYNNPVNGVSTKSPVPLNNNPTVENIYDVVKELNGVGEIENSIMSESWSARVATSLFEYEQLLEINSNEEFKIGEHYNAGVNHKSLNAKFKAILEFMLSRTVRKVNREVYILSQGSYDHHSANSVSDMFMEASNALSDFVNELKSLHLWENTVIVMGSDFGRSINANSNGGTDHAWGGNYFVAGGGVKGGQILGHYPKPMSPENLHWIARSRFIPTTPWEAVWNGIAQWMGVLEDADLDVALPNRNSFDRCSDLFTDKQLFNVGACDCVGGSTACTVLTDPPTPPPTQLPTVSPTPNPSASPTLKPTTLSPTVDLSPLGYQVKTVTPKGSAVTSFGCTDPHAGFLANSIDESTEKYICNRDGQTGLSGIDIAPTHGGLSIVKELRVYTANNCAGCDVTAYILQGRVNPTSSWITIGEGDLDAMPGVNPRGLDIVSTFESGDNNYEYVSVTFRDNTEAFLEYRLTITDWVDTTKNYQFAEIELPGYILHTAPPSSTPTPNPTTAKPTPLPTQLPTMSPTPNPSASPTLKPTTLSPTVDLSPLGYQVKTVTPKGSSVTSFGCTNPHAGFLANSIDESTEKYICNRDGQTGLSGIDIAPTHGGLSIVKELRVYTANNCAGCDVTAYILQGRVNPTSSWITIGEGDLDAMPGVNPRGLDIVSTFESGDNNYEYVSVTFRDNTEAFLEYRLTITDWVDTTKNYQFAEIELPGYTLHTAPPSSPPTNQPTPPPMNIPTPPPTNQPTPSSTKNPTPPPTNQPTPSPTTGSPTTSPTAASPTTASPTLSTSLLQYVGNGGIPAEAFPLGQCQGDCDNDRDCQEGLVCFLRGNYEAVPGCHGEESNQSDDFCFSATNYLWHMGNNGSPASAFPLNACEGDCDNDNECADGLVCLQRAGSEAVPGCDGPGEDGKDYCYNPGPAPTGNPTVSTAPPTNEPTPPPTTGSPTTSPTAASPTTASPTLSTSLLQYVGNGGIPAEAFPLGKCQGDCDNDSDCQEGLVCFLRGNYEAVPGCHGEESNQSDDFCFSATNYLWHMGNNGSPASAFPLNACEGDCDNDSECADGLVCLQRAGSEAVPGCDGPGEDGKDYCYNPGPAPTGNPTILLTNSPTPKPTPTPTTSPIALPAGGDPVKTVTPEGSLVTTFNCNNPRSGVLARSIDGTTEKFFCDRTGQSGFGGIDIVPNNNGRMSIVKGLRVYAHNNCPGCNVAAYILQGRVDPNSSWITIGEGDFDAMPGANSRGLDIVSTFESPDPALAWVAVDFSSNTEAFLEYRLTITKMANPSKTMFQFAEIELPGYLL